MRTSVQCSMTLLLKGERENAERLACLCHSLDAFVISVFKRKIINRANVTKM